MSLFEAVIGFLAPPECIGCGKEGYSLCASCTLDKIIPNGSRCFKCSALTQNFKTCPNCRTSGAPSRVFVVTNHDGIARQLLHTYKFDQQRVASLSISTMMINLLKSINQLHPVSYLVVPVPTASTRVRQRGFDHSILLAKHIAKAYGINYLRSLRRLGQSRQVGASRNLRHNQMSGKFRVNDPRIMDKNILLIDDVITTGATINEASKVLRQAGAVNVDALIFAKRL